MTNAPNTTTEPGRISLAEAGRRHTEWQKTACPFFGGDQPPCYHFDALCLPGCEYGMTPLCAREKADA